MKLSIIIPVYNVEKYVGKCITSCLNQEWPKDDYEIIIINDGSQDSSLSIVTAFTNLNANIVLVSQPNQGLSAARNKGLSIAKGDYVWFIDSDDWISEKSLSLLLPLCEGINVIAIGANYINLNKIVPKVCPQKQSGVGLLETDFFMCVPFYIIKRSFLIQNNLYFMNGISHEDTEFTPRMLYLAGEIFTIQECLYNYLQRDCSITTVINPKRAFDLIKVADSLLNFCKKRVDAKFTVLFYNIIAMCLNNALNIIVKSEKTYLHKWRLIMESKHYFYKILCKSSILKYRLEGILFHNLKFLKIDQIYSFVQLFKK